jgi:ACT domain-containing protein
VSLLKENYIPLLIYNSDEIVMSRVNQKKFHLRFFCKKRGVTLSQMLHVIYKSFINLLSSLHDDMFLVCYLTKLWT